MCTERKVTRPSLLGVLMVSITIKYCEMLVDQKERIMLSWAPNFAFLDRIMPHRGFTNKFISWYIGIYSDKRKVEFCHISLKALTVWEILSASSENFIVVYGSQNQQISSIITWVMSPLRGQDSSTAAQEEKAVAYGNDNSLWWKTRKK